jgi:hypothetical protein
MKLPVIKLLDQASLGKDVPSWFGGVVNYLNQLANPVVTALQNRLSFSDNFDCQVSTLEFVHNVEKIIAIPAGRRVIGAVPLLVTRSTDTTATTKNVWSGFRTDIKGNGTVGITINFAGGGSTQATVTVVTFFG